MKLPNGWLRLAMEMDEERKARLEKMVATAQILLAPIKAVVNVGVVLSLKPILKSCQLYLSFRGKKAKPYKCLPRKRATLRLMTTSTRVSAKLDVLTT